MVARSQRRGSVAVGPAADSSVEGGPAASDSDADESEGDGAEEDGTEGEDIERFWVASGLFLIESPTWHRSQSKTIVHQPNFKPGL